MAESERSAGEELLLLRGNMCRKAKQIVGFSQKKKGEESRTSVLRKESSRHKQKHWTNKI